MISIEKFYLVLKENKKKFVNKIGGFVVSEFVKTCHEYGNYQTPSKKGR